MCRLSCIFLIHINLNIFVVFAFTAPWTKSGASIDRAWHYWQCSCGTRLAEETRNQTSTANNTDVEYLILMLSIMAGKQDCWHDQRVSEACGTWYFHFVGWLFYTHCFVQTSSLATMLEQFKLTFRRNDFQHDEASLEAVSLIFSFNYSVMFIRNAKKGLSINTLPKYVPRIVY